jgi:hypothetical protein
MDAYLVSHNGLGDNLYMIGALHFIKQFYKNVYFLCKQKYYDNVKLCFTQDSNIICAPFNEKNEIDNIKHIIMNKYSDTNTDIFICGPCIKQYFQSKINNEIFLNNTTNETSKYTIDFDTLTESNYSFIEMFYKDIGLNLTYFYEYFNIDSTDESIALFQSVKQYYLVFIQYMSSDGKTLNISNLIDKYLNDPNVLLICNDKNLYNNSQEQYVIAQRFVYNKIVNYIDVIKNSDEIYLIDSCFIGIVLPLLKTNKLKTDKVRIILRDDAKKYIL